MSTRFSAESHTRLWEHLNDLDDDIQARAADTGWQTVDPAAGVTGTCMYRVVGGREVYVRFDLNCSIGTSTTDLTVEFPSEVCPSTMGVTILLASAFIDPVAAHPQGRVWFGSDIRKLAARGNSGTITRARGHLSWLLEG